PLAGFERRLLAGRLVLAGADFRQLRRQLGLNLILAGRPLAPLGFEAHALGVELCSDRRQLRLAPLDFDLERGKVALLGLVLALRFLNLAGSAVDGFLKSREAVAAFLVALVKLPADVAQLLANRGDLLLVPLDFGLTGVERLNAARQFLVAASRR